MEFLLLKIFLSVEFTGFQTQGLRKCRTFSVM